MTYDFCEGKLCIYSLQEFLQINFFKKLLLKDELHEMRDHMVLSWIKWFVTGYNLPNLLHEMPVDNPLGSQMRWLGLT
jgi:hypothetical protein